MSTANRTRTRQRGFSLLEMMVVIAILTLVVGVIFQQVSMVQKRYRTEEAKLDLTQESREFLDQLLRDIHQTGFPNARLYASGVLMSPWQQDSRVAVGLVKFSYTDLWFEGDIDGDGQVESVRYTINPGAGNTCPCTLKRSQVIKVNATDPMSQTTSYSTELDGLVNSGGAGGGSGNGSYPITGTTQIGAGISNQTLYGALAPAYVFTAYDVNGTAVAPCDISSSAGAAQLATIKTIAVTLNVLVKQSRADFETRLRPAISLNASAKISN
jgi:prepilin-type N-terminal cleavage/methylation domain-containing protein